MGDSEALTKYPDAAVLTEELANKFFGNESPIGKTLKLNTQIEVKVLGIIRNTPKNTHMPVDMLVSLNVLNEEILGFNMNEWGVLHSSNASYVLLPKNTAPETINNQLKTFVKNTLMRISQKDIEFICNLLRRFILMRKPEVDLIIQQTKKLY